MSLVSYFRSILLWVASCYGLTEPSKPFSFHLKLYFAELLHTFINAIIPPSISSLTTQSYLKRERVQPVT